MNIAQIEENLQKLLPKINKKTFIYDLLLAYGLPKTSITRLEKGDYNMAKTEGEISWKNKLYFKEEAKSNLEQMTVTMNEIAESLTHKERFVVITDYIDIVALDTKTDDKLECTIKDLAKNYDFFLPWAGMEKAQHVNENPADVKAAEKMAKLFDIIKRDNPDNSPEFIHQLNIFLSRLLFCFFAEDTHIFKDCQFSNAIDSYTQIDGSDLDSYLTKLFKVLNTPDNKRKNLPKHLSDFPYVNGGLFKDDIPVPTFSKSSRSAILNSGDQDWSAINPDIFGSMFQAVIGAEQRGNLGQHYTSVPNIMKVIEPLFLNELYEEFEKAGKNEKKLNELLNRIKKIKIFDPACGSGNFLIIAYKELRILEMKIFKVGGMMALSEIHLSQFYGIEIDDFAGEIAKLSLWLAEHQMNVEFNKEFGRTNPTLPLKEASKIVAGNACRLDWEEVYPKKSGDEVYILGNPPYSGYSKQNKVQKDDLEYVFKETKDYKKLDYISCWFYKAGVFIYDSNSKFAFVTTNSITQGEQVSLFWPLIYKMNLEINFAYKSFKWKNNAKSNAGVTVVVIGVQQKCHELKKIYLKDNVLMSKTINPYLIPSGSTIVKSRKVSLSKLPIMIKGSSPGDGGNLLLSEDEKNELLKSHPSVEKYVKKYIGADEFLKGTIRYCIWIEDDEYVDATKIYELNERFEKVRKLRLSSKKEATRKKAVFPYSFDEKKYKSTSSILFPQTTSENRKYIPIGFLDESFVISNAARIIYDADPWMFGVLTSNIHNAWIQRVAGRLETRIQYSNTLCYNTFPFPEISTQRKNEITQSVFRILEEREKHSEKTLAELYDPDKMPDGLREAHRANDIIIEKCYRSKPFTSDEERLEYLFKLYEKMIQEEKEQGSLFAKGKKGKGK